MKCKVYVQLIGGQTIVHECSSLPAAHAYVKETMVCGAMLITEGGGEEIYFPTHQIVKVRVVRGA